MNQLDVWIIGSLLVQHACGQQASPVSISTTIQPSTSVSQQPPSTCPSDSNSITLIIVVVALGIALGLSLLIHVCCAVKLCKKSRSRTRAKKEEDTKPHSAPAAPVNDVTLSKKPSKIELSTVERCDTTRPVVEDVRYQTLEKRQLPDIPSHEYVTVEKRSQSYHDYEQYHV